MLKDYPYTPHFPFKPSGDQPSAIAKLVDDLKTRRHNVLLGTTGSGKTFTMANVIYQINKPALVIAHNKTLANQLYAEFKQLFPQNKVEYFISNFDFYQPEAYLPKTDTYIEKRSIQNMEIEMMRNSTLASLSTRNDVIVIATVASIYGLTPPDEYHTLHEIIEVGEKINRMDLLRKLVNLDYKRTNDIIPGSFTVKGDIIDIRLPWTDDVYIRIELFGDEIERITEIEPLTNDIIKKIERHIIFPASVSVRTRESLKFIVEEIKKDLKIRLTQLKEEGKDLEHQRLKQRVNFDLEQLIEVGMFSGIENYTRYFDRRKEGESPSTLFDYFPKDFLIFIDESHITIPQLRGMYLGDRSRKESLVNHGFRLPSALDNRPLMFKEIEEKVKKVIYVSATPSEYEFEKSDGAVAEQIVRPTGLLDPIIELRDSDTQIADLEKEIWKRKKVDERVLVNTTSRKLAEDISAHFNEKGLSVAYLHYELKTFERDEVIRKLRLGFFDAIVGINLLREGLDIPEASLIAILDADIEGFLRNKTSLIQMIGRVSRNEKGLAILYCSKETKSIKETIIETNRRRKIQEEYNKTNKIIPKTISKPIRKPLIEDFEQKHNVKLSKLKRKEKILLLEKDMRKAAKEYDFETAIKIRDLIIEIKENY